MRGPPYAGRGADVGFWEAAADRADRQKEDGKSGLRGLRTGFFESQGATGESGKVRCSGVAPCDLFVIILGETEPDGEVDANILGVSGMDRASVRDLHGECPHFGIRRRGRRRYAGRRGETPRL